MAAFDNVVIRRYNKNRESQSKLQVRYVYSPKQRVMFDLVNKAQNITIPVISVSIASVTRAQDRVFNKVPGFYFQKRAQEQDPYQTTTSFMRAPIPVDIAVSMSILTRYQTDMDQIISNFVPYSNPYIIISWAIPSGFNLTSNYEIRSEILWNGSINLGYPTELNSSGKYRITGDTSFTIKGWLFPAAPTSQTDNIFRICAPFHATSDITLTTSYSDLSGETFTYAASSLLVNDLETVYVSGVQTDGFRTNTAVSISSFISDPLTIQSQQLIAKYPTGIASNTFITSTDYLSVTNFNGALSTYFVAATADTTDGKILSGACPLG